MNTFHGCARLVGLIGLLFLLAQGAVTAQEKTQPAKPPQDDDVIRVSTTLVQTDVMVFDKQGKFVEGLKPEQFELKINGKLVPISFFELVTTGSAEEKAQLDAARRAQPATIMGARPTTITPPAGRSIFIFLDDFHLDAESFLRTRKTLLDTIDKEITANDRALITAASGQLGVQHLTTDKEALRAVVARIAPRAGLRQSVAEPPMSEYAAVAINRGDQQVIDYYVEYEMKFNEPKTAEGGSADTVGEKDAAAGVVKSRAESIIDQSTPIAAASLSSLESFMRELANVPGRKLLFFISDGFIIENERSQSYTRLRAATAEAARAGVVIYSLNTRGLVTGSPDASNGGRFDSRLARVEHSAETSGQDVLYTLSADTGGRALVNNNDLNSGVRRALDETSKYYLLAWRPLPENASGENIKRIDLSIAGQPELKVKTRRALAESVSDALAASNSAPEPAAAPAPSAELLRALNSDAPQRGVPTSLVLVYRNAGPAGFVLTASMQLPSAALSFAAVNGRQIATVDVAGVVLDQAGKQAAAFNKRIAIGPDSNVIDPIRKLVFYNYDINLAPGIYQVRLGLRDAKSGLIGSASRSVEIPDLATGRLTLSSLMLNEQVEADDEDTPGEKAGARKGVAQRFAPGSRLRFLTYVYNAQPVAANDNEPDLNVDVKILRGSQPVLSPAVHEIVIDNKADMKSFPYAAEIPLEGLQPGEYTLQVTITDATTKASATQRATFVVE